MIKIQILPQNIPNLTPIRFPFQLNKSLFHQAKDYVLDQDQSIDQNTLIFYYKQQQRIIQENDSVESIFGQDQKPEIELYLFKNFLDNQNKQQRSLQNCDCQQQNLKLRQELDDLKKVQQKNMREMNQENAVLLQQRNEYRKKCDELEATISQQQNSQREQQFCSIIDVEKFKLKHEVEDKNKEIIKLQNSKSELNEMLKIKQEESINMQKKCINLENENQKLKKDLDVLKFQISGLNTSLFEAQSYKKFQELNEISKKELQDIKRQYEQLKIEQQSQIQMIKTRDNLINELQTKVSNQLKEIAKQEQLDKVIQQEVKDLKCQLQLKIQQLEQRENNLKFIRYFLGNKNVKKLMDKLITPINEIFQSKLNPYEFTKSKNVNTNSCKAKVISISIKSKKDILQWLQFKSNEPLDKLIKQEPLKDWDVLKSINKDSQGSKSKCFLMQVQNTNGHYNQYLNQVFSLKTIDGYEVFQNEQYPIFLIYQIIAAQVLAENFQQQLKSLKLPYKFTFQIPLLFIIGENFYIGQQLLNKPYCIFQQNVNDQEIQLFNAFSQFTYRITSGALMVTNMNGGYQDENQYILYEPVIHTPEGIFSPEDYGETAIAETLLSISQLDRNLRGEKLLEMIKYEF